MQILPAFSQNQNINYDKTFLYVGRNHPVKSIDFLVNTWKNIENKKGWRLHLVGCKSFQNFVSENHSIISTNFISGDEISNLMNRSGAFVLASKIENWGVVIHEAALAGLPIICSDSVGSIPVFVINGFNGFVFRNQNKTDLLNTLSKFIELSEDKILSMRTNSSILGTRITTPISAASLISVLNR